MDQNISNNMTIASKLVSFFESATTGKKRRKSNTYQKDVVDEKIFDDVAKEYNVTTDLNLVVPKLRSDDNPRRTFLDAGSKTALAYKKAVLTYKKAENDVRGGRLQPNRRNIFLDKLDNHYSKQLLDFARSLVGRLYSYLSEKGSNEDVIDYLNAYSLGFNKLLYKIQGDFSGEIPRSLTTFKDNISSDPSYVIFGVPVDTHGENSLTNRSNSVLSDRIEFGDKFNAMSTNDVEFYRQKNSRAPKYSPIKSGDTYGNTSDNPLERIITRYLMARESAASGVRSVYNMAKSYVSIIDKERKKSVRANRGGNVKDYTKNLINLAKEIHRDSHKFPFEPEDLGEHDIYNYMVKGGAIKNNLLSDEPFNKKVREDINLVQDLDDIRALSLPDVTNQVMVMEEMFIKLIAEMVLEKFGKRGNYTIVDLKTIEDFINSGAVTSAITENNKMLFDTYADSVAVFLEKRRKVHAKTLNGDEMGDEWPLSDTRNKLEPLKPAEPRKKDTIRSNAAVEDALSKLDGPKSNEDKDVANWIYSVASVLRSNLGPGGIDGYTENNDFLSHLSSLYQENGKDYKKFINNLLAKEWSPHSKMGISRYQFVNRRESDLSKIVKKYNIANVIKSNPSDQSQIDSALTSIGNALREFNAATGNYGDPDKPDVTVDQIKNLFNSSNLSYRDFISLLNNKNAWGFRSLYKEAVKEHEPAKPVVIPFELEDSSRFSPEGDRQETVAESILSFLDSL